MEDQSLALATVLSALGLLRAFSTLSDKLGMDLAGELGLLVPVVSAGYIDDLMVAFLTNAAIIPV